MTMPDTPEDRALVELWRAGDQEAARQLFDNYVDRLVALVRRRISPRLTSRVDPEDVVQSVFRTFFNRLKAGRFRFEEQDDLCKLLMRITLHKTLRQVAFHKAAKRDPNLETGQNDPARERLLELLDREPTPEAAVEFMDQMDHFLNQLRPQERQILVLRLQGYSNDEIAQQLGIYDRKIRRVLERIRGLAEQEGLAP
jgi:RNA polymerase sigma-70 factor (ECF subfamily)